MPSYFQLGAARLYQPDAELKERLPGGTAELSAYIKTLVWVCTEYFSHYSQNGGAFGSLGLLIAAGIKPGGRTRIWVETVDGTLPGDVHSTLEDLLNGAAADARPQATAPVAFALEGNLGSGPRTPFPDIPLRWQSAARESQQPLSVPDGLFTQVFPD